MQATQTRYAVKKKSLRGRSRKEGRGFFLTLLTLSALVILSLLLVRYQGKEIHIFLYEHFVINKDLMSRLPHELSLEETEAFREEVIGFYEAASNDQVNDGALMAVSNRLKTVMEDEIVETQEIASLLRLIRERQAGK